MPTIPPTTQINLLTLPPTQPYPTFHRRHDPYEHLSAPYKREFDHLYLPLTEGERMKLCYMLVTGERHFTGDKKVETNQPPKATPRSSHQQPRARRMLCACVTGTKEVQLWPAQGSLIDDPGPFD